MDTVLETSSAAFRPSLQPPTAPPSFLLARHPERWSIAPCYSTTQIALAASVGL